MNERLMLALSAADQAVWQLDLDTGALSLSPLWWYQLGEPPLPAHHLDDWLERVHPDDREVIQRMLAGAQAGSVPRIECEYRVLHKDGGWRFVRCSAHITPPSAGLGRQVVGVQSDVTPSKLAEQRLRSDAVHDPLTGLANQVLFRERLSQALRRRERPRSLAVMFLDLDRFKNVNDSLGHHAGDQLLVAFAGRIGAVLRTDDTFARLGGDEFGILLEEVETATQVSQVADRVRAVLKRPFTVGGNEVFVSSSIGIALAAPAREAEADELLREADTAMYRAKTAGRGRYAFFDRDMHAMVSEALRLETDLRRAMDRREFKVVYQPIIALGSGRLVGFEALLRWQSPTRGAVSPAEFIPVAEETGAILALGNWVLRKACAQLAAWRTSLRSAHNLYVAVNVSGKQLFAGDLAAEIRSILDHTELPARCLCLELTESTFIDDIERAATLLDRLRAMNVSTALDDFGTGYSSLRSLHRLRFDTLKIDRSFVAELGRGSSEGIVQAIVALAAELGLSTVAEGIESAEQADVLRRLRCRHGQGFHYARPADAAMISRMLFSYRHQHHVMLPPAGAKMPEPESTSCVTPVEITCPIRVDAAGPSGAWWLPPGDR